MYVVGRWAAGAGGLWLRQHRSAERPFAEAPSDAEATCFGKGSEPVVRPAHGTPDDKHCATPGHLSVEQRACMLSCGLCCRGYLLSLPGLCVVGHSSATCGPCERLAVWLCCAGQGAAGERAGGGACGTQDGRGRREHYAAAAPQHAASQRPRLLDLGLELVRLERAPNPMRHWPCSLVIDSC